jgi:hypothetical protein
LNLKPSHLKPETNKKPLEIPKKMWIYDRAFNYITELVFANNKRVGRQSGYESFAVSRENYRKFLAK